MRCKWIVCLAFLSTMVAMTLPAMANYTAGDIVNFFLSQDMGDVHWKGEVTDQGDEEVSWVSYSATAEIDDHEYSFFIDSGHENGEDIVYAMGLSGWYPDLEINGKQSRGHKVYNAFLETLIFFLPDSYELSEIYKPNNIYYMLRGGYSFNYQPQKWYVQYDPQHCWAASTNSNGNYIIANRRTDEDEVSLTNYFSFYFSID